ncbi:glycosyl hydrolase [Pseudomonas sp. ODNR1LW]|nr:glycosyl hydrolase [Pseudomonas sp. ODNR1LW]
MISRVALALAIGALPVVALPVIALAQPPAAVAPQEVGARADALLARMTRDEKLQLIHGYFPPFAERTPGAPVADMIPSAGHIPGIPRLGIPNLRESDASLGVANQVEQRKGDVATALPSSLATAATFDPEIAYAGGAMIGSEARAKTFNILLAGGVNLTRDPWNGRNFEYLGEDPLLAGIMAGDHIRGVQSNKIVSTIKHFAFNSQETGRMIMDARLDEASLRESDLLAFQIAIERGNPGSVMCAYNKVNGDWACENDFLLNQVLKRDWGYDGWVMSDWGAVHSTEKAALAGLDQASGQELDRALYFDAPFREALEAGRIPEARLDDMVRRVLVGLIETGVLDAPVVTTEQPIDYARNAEVAQRAAEAGIVLLKNQGDVLPLAKTAKRIVLIGGHADVGVLSGGGSSQVRSVGGAPVEIPLTSGAAASFARVTWHASSPLNAIRAVSPEATVTYVDGRDPAAAAAAARAADIAVVFATQWTTEAQDVETLSLPEGQDALIEAVAAANGKTVVVLETGGPVLMPWLEKTPAVIQAWYPGQRGGEALARILFGEVNPSGRLPVTIYASSADLPAFTDYGMKERTYRYFTGTPAWPFGHGLSYTRFAYQPPRLPDTLAGGQPLEVAVSIRNTGARPGEEVVQAYLLPPDAGREGNLTDPVLQRQLAGFARVSVAPGQTREVRLTLDPRAMSSVDRTGTRRVLPGAYRLWLGGGQPGDADGVWTRFVVTGEAVELPK